MPISKGNVVISKKGRDKDRVFVVLYTVDAVFAFISDGKTHLVSRPKKKKLMHLCSTPVMLGDVCDMYEHKTLKDSDVRAALAPVQEALKQQGVLKL